MPIYRFVRCATCSAVFDDVRATCPRHKKARMLACHANGSEEPAPKKRTYKLGERIEIRASQISFTHGGNTIWVDGPDGTTILRLKLPSGTIRAERLRFLARAARRRHPGGQRRHLRAGSQVTVAPIHLVTMAEAPAGTPTTTLNPNQQFVLGMAEGAIAAAILLYLTLRMQTWALRRIKSP